jgi:hypothetical protein
MDRNLIVRQLLVYADDVNILAGSIQVYTIKEQAEALVEAGKKTGLDINVDKKI